MGKLAKRLPSTASNKIAAIALVVGLPLNVVLVSAVASPKAPTSSPIAAQVSSSPESSASLASNEPETRTELVTETVPIPFDKVKKEDDSVEIGTNEITQNGVAGERTITYKVTYENGIEVSRKKISSKVTKKAIDEVTTIGMRIPPPISTREATPACDNNYLGGCVPISATDLDCPDISFSVTVVGQDKHGFDGDGDGSGCESY